MTIQNCSKPLFCLLVCIVIVGVFGQQSVGQQTQAVQQSQDLKSTTPPKNDLLIEPFRNQVQAPTQSHPQQHAQMIQAIKEIRQQVGGLDLELPRFSIGNLNLPNPPAIETQSPKSPILDFENELIRLANLTADPKTKSKTESRNRLKSIFEKSTWDRTLGLQPAEDQSNPTIPIRFRNNSIPQNVTSLRSAARNLELAAADLEDAGNYEMADQLRLKAQNVRVSARKLVANQPTGPAN